MSRAVSRETRLKQFAAGLRKANQTTNLVSRRLSEDDLLRMVFDFADTMEAVGVGPPEGLIDVGSGGGLPGIPLAIRYPDSPVVLCEYRKLRTAWLARITSDLGLTNTTVLPGRVESFPELEAAFPAATAFGVGNPANVIGMVAPLLAPGGLGILSAPNAPTGSDEATWLLAAAVNGCSTKHHPRALGGRRALLTLHRDP